MYPKYNPDAHFIYKQTNTGPDGTSELAPRNCIKKKGSIWTKARILKTFPVNELKVMQTKCQEMTIV